MAWYCRWGVFVVLGVFFGCAIANRAGWMGESLMRLCMGMTLSIAFALDIANRHGRIHRPKRDLTDEG